MKSLKAVLAAALLCISLNTAFAGQVDINAADAKTLASQIKGVGPKTAEAIVAYRSKHGPFKNIDELTKVKGIGPKTVERNRANLTVGGARK